MIIPRKKFKKAYKIMSRKEIQSNIEEILGIKFFLNH